MPWRSRVLVKSQNLNIVMRSDELIGRRFGYWMVRASSNKRAHAFCDCDCGNSVEVNIYNLLDGKTTSCGCRVFCTHHLSRSREYKIWSNMKCRCFNPNTKSYNHYGARGITVCDRWVNSFQNFINDVGFSPTKNHSLDRINNDGNYEPGNCKWSTVSEQKCNTRSNRLITFEGETKTVSQWASFYKLSYFTIISRLNKNWPVWRIFNDPDIRFRSKTYQS